LKGNRNNVNSSEVSNRQSDNSSSNSNELLTKDFLRKYIHYAKNRIQPVLSDEAMEIISTSYANMRSRQTKKNLPITARTLETIIRLSTASAKSRLSVSVDEVDVEMAMELMNFVLFHDIGNDDNNNNSSSGRANIPSVLQSMNNQLLTMNSKSGGKQQQQLSSKISSDKENQPPSTAISVYDDLNEDEQWDESMDITADSKISINDLESELRTHFVAIDTTSKRYLEVAALMSELLSAELDSISLNQLMKRLNNNAGPDKQRRRRDAYSHKEILSILLTLELNNRVSSIMHTCM